MIGDMLGANGIMIASKMSVGSRSPKMMAMKAKFQKRIMTNTEDVVGKMRMNAVLSLALFASMYSQLKVQ